METSGNAYTCNAYTPDGSDGFRLADVPATWWEKIELAYPDGGKVVLVYDREPEDRELHRLMWELQVKAAEHGFEVIIHNADGTTARAEPIPFRARDSARHHDRCP